MIVSQLDPQGNILDRLVLRGIHHPMDPLILERGSEVFSLGGDGACAVSVVMVGKVGPGWGVSERGHAEPCGRVVFDQENLPARKAPRVLSYRATVDVPITTVRTISGWLTAHRRAYDIRPHQRACTTWGQAVLVLRWLKDGTDVRTPARDAGVSQATGYRYHPRGLGGGRPTIPRDHQRPGQAPPGRRAVRPPGRDPGPH